MTNIELKKFLNACESKTVNGEGHLITKPLRAIYATVKTISIENRIKYCNLLYRNGQFDLALKVIHRLISANPQEDFQSLAGIEYAKSLMMLGKFRESQRILQTIDFKKFPMAQYQLGYCYSMQWNFKEAIDHTESFLKSNHESHYFNTLAQLNNMIDIAYLDSSRLSKDHIDSVLNEINTKNYTLLKAVAAQVQGRYYLHKANYRKAHAVFSEGIALIKGSESFDLHYLQKWRLVSEFHLRKDLASIKKKFLLLRDQAQRSQDYGTVRECDFYLGHLFQDLKSAQFCYLGTPFAGFKKWFMDHGLYSDAEIKADGILIGKDGFVSSSSARKKNIDLSGLPKTVLKTFFALTHDFYQWPTLVNLHEQIFPEQKWNPFSSPGQMKQLLFRLRKELKEINPRLTIVEKNQSYRLNYNEKKNVLHIKSRELQNDPFAHLLFQIESKFSKEAFSFADFQRLANQPRRSAQRLLSTLISIQKIQSFGQTRQTKYKLS